MKKKLLLALILLCVLAVIVFCQPHLRWKFTSMFAGYNDVLAIPTLIMPDELPPESWHKYRFGPLEFSLPPELATTLDVKSNDKVVVLVFDDEYQTVIMTVPTIPEDRECIVTALQDDYDMPPEGHRLSLVQLRLASYRTSSEDFRWSMTTQELRWHIWCIRMSSAFRITSGSSAEYLLHDDVEGILNLTSEVDTCSFDWQTHDDSFGGSIMFTDKRDSIDKAWIRHICQSFKFTNIRLPQTMPLDSHILRDLSQAQEKNNGICPIKKK